MSSHEKIKLSALAEDALLSASILIGMAKEFDPGSESAMLFQKWSDQQLHVASKMRQYVMTRFDPELID